MPTISLGHPSSSSALWNEPTTEYKPKLAAKRPTSRLWAGYPYLCRMTGNNKVSSFMLLVLHCHRCLSIKARRHWPSYAACSRNLQGIGPDSHLPRSRYTTSEKGVEPLASPFYGYWNGGQWILKQLNCDAATNLPRGIQQQGGRYPTQTIARYLWSYKQSPLCGFHLRTPDLQVKNLIRNRTLNLSLMLH